MESRKAGASDCVTEMLLAADLNALLGEVT
jgi:hypothetical protein